MVYHSVKTRDNVAAKHCGHVVRPDYCVVKNFTGRYSNQRLERVQLCWIILEIRVSWNLAKLGEVHKISGMEGREDWIKLCSQGRQSVFSTGGEGEGEGGLVNEHRSHDL